MFSQADDAEREPHTPSNDPCPHTPDETPPLSPTGPCTPTSSTPSPHTRHRHHTKSHLPKTYFSETCNTSTDFSTMAEDGSTKQSSPLESDVELPNHPSLSPNKEGSPTHSRQNSTSPSPQAVSHLSEDTSTTCSRKQSSRKKRRSTEAFRSMVSLLLFV